VFTAVCTPKKVGDEYEVLRRILYQAITRYCRSNPCGHKRLLKAVADPNRLPASLTNELQRIAFDEVVPSLSPNDRLNYERTLRSRRGPLPDGRPPSYPDHARGPKEARRALGL
jgi:hypothetical protein